MEPMKSFTWWHAMDFHSVRPSSVYVVGRLGLSLESGWAYLQQTFFFVVPGLQSQFWRPARAAGVFRRVQFQWQTAVSNPVCLSSVTLCLLSPCVQSPPRHLSVSLSLSLSPDPRESCSILIFLSLLELSVAVVVFADLVLSLAHHE